MSGRLLAAKFFILILILISQIPLPRSHLLHFSPRRRLERRRAKAVLVAETQRVQLK